MARGQGSTDGADCMQECQHIFQHCHNQGVEIKREERVKKLWETWRHCTSWYLFLTLLHESTLRQRKKSLPKALLSCYRYDSAMIQQPQHWWAHAAAQRCQKRYISSTDTTQSPNESYIIRHIIQLYYVFYHYILILSKEYDSVDLHIFIVQSKCSKHTENRPSLSLNYLKLALY